LKNQYFSHFRLLLPPQTPQTSHLNIFIVQDLLKARAEKAANIRAQEEAKANGYGISGEGAESLRAAASVNSMTATRIAEVWRWI